MKKSLRVLLSAGAFAVLMAPAVLTSKGFWRGAFSGRDCARIARSVPRRLAYMLHGNFIWRYAQLTPQEERFIAVINILQRLPRFRVEVEFLDKHGVLEKIAAMDEQCILVAPHYVMTPLVRLTVAQLPLLDKTWLAADPDALKRYVTGELGLSLDHIEVIKSDPGCLRLLEQERRPLVLCAPDYHSRSYGICDTVSGGIFAYAFRVGARMFGAAYELTDEGQILVDLKEIEISEDIDWAVKQFIEHQKPERTYQPKPRAGG